MLYIAPQIVCWDDMAILYKKITLELCKKNIQMHTIVRKQ